MTLTLTDSDGRVWMKIVSMQSYDPDNPKHRGIVLRDIKEAFANELLWRRDPEAKIIQDLVTPPAPINPFTG